MRQLEKTYDVEALRRRVPADRAQFFVGFTPWPEDLDGWRRSARERHTEGPGRPLSRTIWDHPSSRDVRVLIDVAEASSQEDAIESLIGRLESNQLARLTEGPSDLGSAAFAHPEGVPPAVFFARGNVCVSVVSFGSRPADVLPIARRIDRRLDERPAAARAGLSMTSDRPQGRVDEPIALDYALTWTLGEDGYAKFFVAGATISRRDGRLFLRASRAGEVTVDAFIVERGRETYSARAVLRIE
jgi:hypothetical protein